tara:strand:+ start:790 stop:2325 length:1536 start_codon:yes stop_codon:yes gene_type:complete
MNLENWNISDGRNLANIDIPGNIGFTDLVNSHLVLKMTCKADVGTVRPTYIGDVQNKIATAIGNNIYTPKVGPECIIRNARVSSKEFGLLNEQRRQNLVNCNLDWYKDSRSAARNDALFGQTPIDRSGLAMPESAFVDLVRPVVADAAVNTASSYKACEVKIPLVKIDRFADTIRQFPNIATGDLRYHIELETNYNVAGTSDLNDIVSECTDRAAVGSLLGDSSSPIAIATVGANSLSLPDNKDYNKLQWYVGAPVKLSYDDGAAKTHTTTISNLVISLAGVVTFELTVGAPTAAPTSACTDITLEFVRGATATWNITNVLLELHCLQLTPQQTENAAKALKNLAIPFVDYDLITKNMDVGYNFSDVINVGSNAIGVVAITPLDADTICSGFDGCTSYRYAVDGNNTTNRDIVCGFNNTGRQLHNHRLQQFLGNCGHKLRKFDDAYPSFTSVKGGLGDMMHVLYPQILPRIGREQLVNFRLDGNLHSAKEILYLILYQREIRFKAGQVQVL